MYEYTMVMLVRKPEGTYTFGTSSEQTVVANSVDEAVSIASSSLEEEGWEVERLMSVRRHKKDGEG
jgi:hypothetical protein